MPLSLQSEILDSVIVIRCEGRIISGEEIRILQREVDKAIHVKKRIVLDLAGITHIDSAGLGFLVRLFGMLRADGGGLKVSRVSNAVLKALQITHLNDVLPTYNSDKEAIEAFLSSQEPARPFRPTTATIVCIDESPDVLAYLNALLAQAGYEVFVTRFPTDARTLVKVIRPHLVIVGLGGGQITDSAIERIRQTVPALHILLLPSDFPTPKRARRARS